MHCSTCGFTAADWSLEQALGTLRILPRWFDLLAEDASPETQRLMVGYADRVTAAARDHDSDSLARVHDGLHALHEAGRLRREVGEGAPSATGQVVQLNASGGGVPKIPVATARITSAGMAGDAQHDRQHHGRPWQALCLWSAEVIDGLAAEGHPIGYGNAGENVTVRGIDWPTLRPGVQLHIGTVLVETTPYAIPCRKNARWFLGGDFGRMAHERQPGVSRIYAQVLTPGTIFVGDPFVVEPA